MITSRDLFACFEQVAIQYWYNADGTLLAETHYGIGEIAEYPFDNPTHPSALWPFSGWGNTLVTSQVMCFYAQFQIPSGLGIDMTWPEVEERLNANNVSDLTGKRFIADFGTYGAVIEQIVGVGTTLGAKIDCIPITVLKDMTRWNTSAVDPGVWANSSIRSHCSSVLTQLQSDIKSHVVQVTKYSFVNDIRYGNNHQSSDQLWIPNCRELVVSSLESLGPSYSSIYKNDGSRIKRTMDGKATTYWTRSNGDSYETACVVEANGSGTNSIPPSVTSLYGVSPGFCLI